VARGRDPGIYTDWESAAEAIKGWKGPKYKRFDTRQEAAEFIRTHGNVATEELVGDKGGKAKLKDDSEADVHPIYTDGSSLANGRAGAVAGVGVYFGPGDKR
jgi:ribonuclease HI